MKTAVSIPDDVFSRADALAKRRNQSRSQLYAEALVEYLCRHDDEHVTAAMDAALAGLAEPDGEDDFREAAQAAALERVEW